LPISALIFPTRNLYSVRYLEPVFLTLFIFVIYQWKNELNAKKHLLLLLFIPLIILSQEAANGWNAPLQAAQSAYKNNTIPLKAQNLLDALSAHRQNEANQEVKQFLIKSMIELDELCVKQPIHYDNFDPCWVYYYQRYQLAADPGQKAFFGKIYLNSLRAYHVDFATWREFEFAVQQGNATPELASKWLAQYAYLTTPFQRILALSAECLLGSSSLAKGHWQGFLDHKLLLPDGLETTIQDWNPAFRQQIRACLN